MRQRERHPFRAIGLMTAISSQLVGSVLVGILGDVLPTNTLILNRSFDCRLVARLSGWCLCDDSPHSLIFSGEEK